MQPGRQVQGSGKDQFASPINIPVFRGQFHSNYINSRSSSYTSASISTQHPDLKVY